MSIDIEPEPTIQSSNVQINRPCYNQKNFEDKFLLNKISSPESRTKVKAVKLLKQINFMNIFGIFTILDLITRYDFKKTLIADILSGLTG
jgi:hypothetical protein